MYGGLMWISKLNLFVSLVTCSCHITSMGMALKTIEMYSHWFAGPVFGKTYLLMIDAIPSGQKFGRSHKLQVPKWWTFYDRHFWYLDWQNKLSLIMGHSLHQKNSMCFIGKMESNIQDLHPTTLLQINGAIERFIQTFKRALNSGRKEGRDTQHVISNFLLRYCSTPHTLTGVTPCTQMLKRDIRTRLHLLRPGRESGVISGQADQKSNHDKRCKMREFKLENQ